MSKKVEGEPIGSIACPLCDRAAHVVKFSERTKLDPAGGEGKAAYPRKVYVVCPPVTGYAGCGSILANSLEGQARIMDTAKIFGPEGKPAAASSSPAPASAKAAPAAPNKPAEQPAKKSSSLFW